MQAAGRAQPRPARVPVPQRTQIGHPGRAPGAGNPAAGAGVACEFGELHLPGCDLFSAAGILSQVTSEKMPAGLSSRPRTAGLEPAGQAVEHAAAPTSKPALSRRLVTAETGRAELMTRRMDDLDLVAFMTGVAHFGSTPCIVALGISIDGTRHPRRGGGLN